MTTVPNAVTRAKRKQLPKKSRIELAREFDELPATALVDQSQAAAFLNCSEGLLEHHRWAGTGPQYLKTGRLVRYRKTDVLAYLEGKTRTSTTGG